MQKAQPISVSAMILCDGVATDPVTGKTTIVGSSTGFGIDTLPAKLPPFAVFIRFSEVTRRTRIDLRMLNSDYDTIFELTPGFVDPGDAVANVDADPRFLNVEIEDIGDYYIQLFADNVYIMELRFSVVFNTSE